MQVELAGRRRRRKRRNLLPAAASRQTPSPTCIHTDRTTKYALRVLGRAKRVYVSPSYPKDSWVLLLLILVVSSADAQLSLSLGQHNTDQADVVRGLIKISAHISLCYISRVRSSVVPIILYTLLTLIQVSLPSRPKYKYLT